MGKNKTGKTLSQTKGPVTLAAFVRNSKGCEDTHQPPQPVRDVGWHYWGVRSKRNNWPQDPRYLWRDEQRQKRWSLLSGLGRLPTEERLYLGAYWEFVWTRGPSPNLRTVADSETENESLHSEETERKTERQLTVQKLQDDAVDNFRKHDKLTKKTKGTDSTGKKTLDQEVQDYETETTSDGVTETTMVLMMREVLTVKVSVKVWVTNATSSGMKGGEVMSRGMGTNTEVLSCLWWRDKVRTKEKTYTWVSVRWKTSWGIYTTRIPVVYYESIKWEVKEKTYIWVSVWWKTKN